MNQVKWSVWDAPVTREVVEEVAKKLHVRFPSDYIECAMANHGGHVSPHLFLAEGKERVFGTLLSYVQEDSEYIVEVFHDYKETLPAQVIPIAFDPAGNLLCFDYKNHEDHPIIVFWEHENAAEKKMLMHEEGLTAEQTEERARENIFYVADSFTEFLEKLYE